SISGGNENGTVNTLSFPAGTALLTQTIAVTTNGDIFIEPDEVVTVTLINPSINAVLAPDNIGTSSFLNDDSNTISMGPGVSLAEGNGGTTPFAFTASRTGDT